MAATTNLQVNITADGRQMTKSLAALEGQLARFQAALKYSTDPNAIGRLNRAIETTQGRIAGLRTHTGPGGPAAKMQKDFTGLSRVVQDLPFGFIAISNNLTQLLPAAGGLGLAFSGLVAALTFAQTGLSNWTRGLSRSSSGVDVLKQSIKSAGEAIGEDIVRLQIYRAKLNDVNIPAEKRVKILREYNEGAHKSNQIDEKQINNLELINDRISAQNTLLIQRALTTAAVSKLTEAATGLIENETKLQAKLNTLGFENLEQYEQSQKDALKARTNAFLAGTLQDGQVNKSAQVLDNYSRVTNQAGDAVRKADLEIGNLISDVKEGRAELEKMANNLKGVITIEGLTTDDGVVKQAKELAHKIRSEITKIVGSREGAVTAFFSVELAMEKAVNEPSPTDFERLIRYRLGNKKIEPRIPITPKFEIKEATELELQMEALANNINSTFKAAAESGMASFAEGIGAALAGGSFKNIFFDVADSIGTLVQDLGKMLIKAAIQVELFKSAFFKTLLANPALAIAVGAGLVIAGGAIKASMPKVKPFAQGGLVSGPTLALVGEGQGTSRSNPEVITPLDKLKDMLGNQDTSPNYKLAFEVSGATLRAWYKGAMQQGGRRI